MAAGASPPTKANRTPNTQGPEPGSQNMWATTRMLAQKQPPIQRVRNSSLVEWTCADNIRG